MRTNLPRDPRVGRLARRLGRSRLEALAILELLIHFGIEQADDGGVGRHEPDDLAEALWWDESPDLLERALVESGWLVEDEAHRLIIVDWREHAPDFVHRRLARQGRAFADGSLPKSDRGSGKGRPLTDHVAPTDGPRGAHGAPTGWGVVDHNGGAGRSVGAPTQADPSQGGQSPAEGGRARVREAPLAELCEPGEDEENAESCLVGVAAGSPEAHVNGRNGHKERLVAGQVAMRVLPMVGSGVAADRASERMDVTSARAAIVAAWKAADGGPVCRARAPADEVDRRLYAIVAPAVRRMGRERVVGVVHALIDGSVDVSQMILEDALRSALR